MGHTTWRPSAAPPVLRARAKMLAEIRAYFARAGVMEVETPLCSRASGTDPALEPLRTRYTGPGAPTGEVLYLQTSPEFSMKRLIAAGSGPIYQICKAFRDGERGALHNPEFSLLEWYRPGFDHHRLMDEVADLVRVVMGRRLPLRKLTYAEAFSPLGIDPHTATAADLKERARVLGMAEAEHLELDAADPWLDLLFTGYIECALGRGDLCLVYDYPASKASLARVRSGVPAVAERFELYIDGVELANGFHELADAGEQQERFRRELAQRALNGRSLPAIDQNLLAALEAGLPDCSGVAIGLDRLLMVLLGKPRIDQVLAFPLERA